MLVFRITLKDFSSQLYASGLSARWNGESKKVIYCAETIALALLENMVRRQGVGFNSDFKIMFIQIPDILKITNIELKSLPNGWRDFRDYSFCQTIGNRWYDEGKTPLLRVPSAVLPEAFNIVINTNHTDYNKIKLIETTDLIPDERIDDLLKKYRAKS